MSLKESFFAAKGAIRHENYTLPDGTVLVISELGADEWFEIKIESMRHRAALDPNGSKPDLLYEARVIARSVMDDKGNLVFDPTDEDELKRIAKEPARTFDPLMAAVNRVNASGEVEHEKLKKNSETAQT